MPSEIIRVRVAFPTITVGDTKIVSRTSTPLDCAHMRLRAIVAPAGIALGTIGITTCHDDFGKCAVPLDLEDVDETATLLRIADDWPLFTTTFTVEHARDEPFELFLIAENR